MTVAYVIDDSCTLYGARRLLGIPIAMYALIEPAMIAPIRNDPKPIGSRFNVNAQSHRLTGIPTIRAAINVETIPISIAIPAFSFLFIFPDRGVFSQIAQPSTLYSAQRSVIE